jgi:hypothetical protein
VGGGRRSTNSWDVFGRIYDANNAPSPNVFRWNSRSYGDQYVPQVAAIGECYAAVWTGLGQDGSWEGVFGQLVSKGSTFEGGEFGVNATTLSRQIHPVIASGGTGRCLVVWASHVVGAVNMDLYARDYQLSE